MHSALLAISTSLLGLSTRFQPEWNPEGLQGHVGEYGRAGRVQAGDEDHHRSDSGDSRPGEVYELLGPGPSVHQGWRRRRFVAPLLRHGRGSAGGTGRREGCRQFGHVHHCLLATAAEE